MLGLIHSLRAYAHSPEDSTADAAVPQPSHTLNAGTDAGAVVQAGTGSEGQGNAASSSASTVPNSSRPAGAAELDPDQAVLSVSEPSSTPSDTARLSATANGSGGVRLNRHHLGNLVRSSLLA